MGREYLDLDPAGTPTGFSAWLRSSLADAGGSDTDVVELSTFHAAKGLEWKVVHLAGVEKGLIPIHFAETQGELAEETRLFYVAITRAEDELVLHRAEKRTTGTREMRRKPSAFLEPVEAALDFLNGVEHRRPRAPRSRQGHKSAPVTKAGLTGADAELFGRLRAWRLEQSRAAKARIRHPHRRRAHPVGERPPRHPRPTPRNPRHRPHQSGPLRPSAPEAHRRLRLLIRRRRARRGR